MGGFAGNCKGGQPVSSLGMGFVAALSTGSNALQDLQGYSKTIYNIDTETALHRSSQAIHTMTWSHFTIGDK